MDAVDDPYEQTHIEFRRGSAEVSRRQRELLEIAGARDEAIEDQLSRMAHALRTASHTIGGFWGVLPEDERERNREAFAAVGVDLEKIYMESP